MDIVVARIEFPNPTRCENCQLCHKNVCTGTADHMTVDIDAKERPSACPITVVILDSSKTALALAFKLLADETHPCPPEYLDVLNKRMGDMLG